jgi:hypothetical protein
MSIKQIIKDKAKITFEALPEDTRPEDYFDTQALIDHVISESKHNPYAWFVAKVTVEFNGLTATDYLGACSYESESDFMRDGYYADMVNVCIDEIAKQVSQIRAL